MNGAIVALVLSAFQVAELPQFARITFNVPIDAEQGGGTAIGAAGKVEFVREDFVVASGGVSLRYLNTRLSAQRIEVDLENNTAQALGEVVLDEGPRRIAGDRLEYDLDAQVGTMYGAQAYVAPDLYFYGDEVRKTGEDTYEVIDGVLTSCDDEVPDWSFRLSKAKIRVEGFARVTNTRMRVKKLPFLYFPYLAFPAKSERASGFLMPNLGYSDRQGWTAGFAYFQTLGPSFDTTIFGDYYGGGEFSEEAFWSLGNEFRYAPSEVTNGIFTGQVVDDPVGDTTRWRINWNHQSNDLPGGMRLVVNHADFSDFDFFRDFSRNFNDITVRQIQSTGFLSGAWGKHLLNVLLEKREAFINQNLTRENRQLPEVQYRLNQTQVGNLPLYASLLSSANYFQLFANSDEVISYARGDILPQLTAPISAVPWLSVSAVVAGRVTWWSDSLRVDDGMDDGDGDGEEPPSPFTGEALTRTLGIASVQVIGPSFSKVFHGGIGSFSKFKHIIEPRLSYGFTSEFEEQNQVLRFDEVDGSAPQEIATFSLINRLLAKPEDELLPGREIMSFELTQRYSLREDQPFQRFVTDDGEVLEKQESPITANYRFNPSFVSSLNASTTFNTLFNQFNNAQLSLRSQLSEQANVGLSWVMNFDPETGDTTSSQVGAGASFNLFRSRFYLQSGVNYDIEESMLQQASQIIQYTSQCWALRLELREFRSATREDRDIRLALSLNNIGTFLDLNSSTRDNGNNGFF